MRYQSCLKLEFVCTTLATGLQRMVFISTVLLLTVHKL